MRVVNPSRAERTGTATRTMTSRLVALRPVWADLVDAGFLIVLVMVAMLGFVDTFDSTRYLLFALVGVLLGVVLAHLTNVLRWHWLLAVALSIVAYAIGGLLIAGGNLLDARRIVDVGLLAVDGWKELLTVLPPLPGDSRYIVLPYLMAVVVGAWGFAAARRTRRLLPAIVLPTMLFIAVILLGTLAAPAAIPLGLGFGLLAFGWLVARGFRRRQVVGTGARNHIGVAMGAGVIVVALAGAFFAGPYLPGLDASRRVVLRTYIQPPIDLPSYASPLSGFRSYSSDIGVNHDKQLLTIGSTVAARTWVRFAVMDDYSGTAWTATAGGVGTAATGFQRIGTRIPNPPDGQPYTGTITIDAGYASHADLRYWLPSFGQPQTIVFEGEYADSHVANLRYNISTGQALIPDALRAGDVVTTSAVPFAPLDLGQPAQPGGQPVVSQSHCEPFADGIKKMTSDDQDRWSKLVSVAAYLKAGYWSDGTLPGEEQYRPGHGQARLVVFLGDTAPIGSDEQYAATMGVVANCLGYPARVVLGAELPAEGVIAGKDVSAWVQVLTDDGQWHDLLPSAFIPARDKRPVDIPPPTYEEQSAVDVPPPNPVRPPGSFDPQFSAGEHTFVTGNPWIDALIAIGLAVLRYAGPPLAVIALIIAVITGLKASRRSRRRKKGEPTTQIAGGWTELMDVARDMGHSVPMDGTRREQTLAVGRADLVELSQAADSTIFGEIDPSPQMAAGYWTRVKDARKTMLRSLKRVRRWRARLSLRSLLPNNVRLPSAAHTGEAVRAMFARTPKVVLAAPGTATAVIQKGDVPLDDRTVRR